jgi:hypothetical protein
MYARIENGAVVEWPIMNLFQRLPQVSFAEVIDNSNLPDGFVFVRPAIAPEYDTTTHTIALSDLALVNGVWQQEYTVVPLSEEELQRFATETAWQVRQDRDLKLTASDWTQVADAPVDKAAWATYRQALRDITTQAGFPSAVVWPVVPTS